MEWLEKVGTWKYMTIMHHYLKELLRMKALAYPSSLMLNCLRLALYLLANHSYPGICNLRAYSYYCEHTVVDG